MAEERNTRLTTTSETTSAVRAPETDTATDDEATKAELQRRMEEAREQISHTVAEIRETVSTQYESVRESINEVFDWRVQVSRRPAAFSAGALGAGLLLGLAVGGAISGRRSSSYSSEYDYDDEDMYDYSDDYAPTPTARSYRASLADSTAGYSAVSATPAAAASSSYSSYSPSSSTTDYDRSSLTSQSTSYTSDSSAAEEQSSGPGLFERFQGTAAYDRLINEVTSVGNRLVDELSHTAQTVAIPMLLGKLKDAIGIDLGAQRHETERSKAEQEAGQARSNAIEATQTSASNS